MIERLMDDRLRRVEIKLGAVGQRVEDHERDFETIVGPLVKELHEMRWSQGEMKKSIDAAHDAVRDLSGRLDREHDERITGQLERKRELEEAQAARNQEIAKIEKDRESQYLDIQSRAEQAKLESRRMFYGLVGIFATSLASVLASILGGGGTP